MLFYFPSCDKWYQTSVVFWQWLEYRSMFRTFFIWFQFSYLCNQLFDTLCTTSLLSVCNALMLCFSNTIPVRLLHHRLKIISMLSEKLLHFLICCFLIFWVIFLWLGRIVLICLFIIIGCGFSLWLIFETRRGYIFKQLMVFIDLRHKGWGLVWILLSVYRHV